MNWKERRQGNFFRGEKYGKTGWLQFGLFLLCAVDNEINEKYLILFQLDSPITGLSAGLKCASTEDPDSLRAEPLKTSTKQILQLEIA